MSDHVGTESVSRGETLSGRVMDAIVNSDCYCAPGDATCEDWIDANQRHETIHRAVMRVIDRDA